MPGINVRQDGDVIRIELPGDQLFNFGTAQLKPGADGAVAKRSRPTSRRTIRSN